MNSRVPQMDTALLREAFDLAACAASVAEARHRTAAWLFRYPVGPQAAEAAVLIVSELVTNAIVHSGSDVVSCALRLGSGLLRIEVTDQGVGVAEPTVREPADDDVSGRGLMLVSGVCEAWGVCHAIPGRRTVWATVRAGLLAVHEFGSLVEQLRPGGDEAGESRGGTGAEYGGAVAVLEREPDIEVPLDRGTHRVASHQPQQLATGRLVGRGHEIVGKFGTIRSEVRDQAGDHVPRIGQRGADTVQERDVIHLAALCLLE